MANSKIKKTFVFYNDWTDYTNEMTNEEAGIFLKAILSYQNGDPPDLDGGIKFIRGRIKKQLDEDNKKRAEEVEKRRNAGIKGNEKRRGKSRKCDEKVANATKKQKNIADNENDNVNENKKKERYKDFVLLSPSEYSTLKGLIGENELENYIESLNNYIGQKGKKYKSHYHTIRNWRNKDQKNNSPPKNEEYSAEKRKI